jgi:hypothetical protein
MSTVPQSCIGDSILRQIRVGPTWTKAWWSSVISGTDQLRWTELPLRTALRSLTGRANSSDGGSGLPGVPQPTQTANIPMQTISFNFLQSLLFVVSCRISFYTDVIGAHRNAIFRVDDHRGTQAILVLSRAAPP